MNWKAPESSSVEGRGSHKKNGTVPLAKEQAFPLPPQRSKPHRPPQPVALWDRAIVRYAYMFALHMVCISIYAIPMFFWKSPHDRGSPVLDEVYFVTTDNQDIYVPPAETNKDNDAADVCDDIYNELRWAWCWWKHNNMFQTDPVWTNDYWGRPMTSPSSHKSWRPLSALSFRYLRFYGQIDWNDLVSHRVVNVLLHTATGELVALLALLLLSPRRQRQRRRKQTQTNAASFSSYQKWLYTLTKLLFCLHPTHVEVTANAANRPHLIAVAMACLLANPYLPYPLFCLCMIVGFLSAETFLFGVVPAAATLVLIHYRQTYRFAATGTVTPSPSLWRQTLSTLAYCLCRLVTLLVGAAAYYGGRSYMDWLNIPTGLIRPAENPYFRLTGNERIVNYAHVTALHVAKSWDMDWVGFSHEYGYQCLTPIESFSDVRLWTIPVPMGLVLIVWPFVWFILMGQCVSTKERYELEGTPAPATTTTTTTSTAPTRAPDTNGAELRNEPPTDVQPAEPSAPTTAPQESQQISLWSTWFLLWMFHLSWLATLFPIMGIVKVGTFVADRIVVPSSVSVCILVAHVFASWLATNKKHRHDSQAFSLFTSHNDGSYLPIAYIWRYLLIFSMLAVGWRRIHLRTWDWMDPYLLLQSSLETCPRSAKSHLEISKIYSGLYDEHYDLKRARWHLQQVEEIDPTYCDVHYQYVHCGMQEQDGMLEFEERLVQALTCPFTTRGAMHVWQQYWQIVLGPLGEANPPLLESSKRRQELYKMQLSRAAEEETEKEEADEDADTNSHFVNWRGT